MTPAEHRDAAAQLLADVDQRPESPGEQRVLTQAAIAHALLGLLELQIGACQEIVKQLSPERTATHGN